MTKILLSLFLTFLCCGVGCGPGECDPADFGGFQAPVQFKAGPPPFTFRKPIVGGNLHFGGPVSGGTTTGGVPPTAPDGGLTKDAGTTAGTVETPL